MLLGLLVWVVAEVAALVAVASAIGLLPAIALLIAVSATGPWLVRRAGMDSWRRAQAHLAAGEPLDADLVDGLLLLGGGFLVCVPGFVGDAVGAVLLFPPLRAAVRRRVGRRAARSLVNRFGGPGSGTGGDGWGPFGPGPGGGPGWGPGGPQGGRPQGWQQGPEGPDGRVVDAGSHPVSDPEPEASAGEPPAQLPR